MKDGKLKAKMKALMDLKREMSDSDSMGLEDVKPMQKVTIMSDSKEGLKKGLSKAQEIMKKYAIDNMDMDEEDAEEYACGGAAKEDGGVVEKDMEMSEEDEEEKKEYIKKMMK